MKVKEEIKVDFIKWFSEVDKNSGLVAGGKGANLGEIYNMKVPVPPGFVVTAQAYDYFIEKAGIKDEMNNLLKNLDFENTEKLNETTKKIRELIIKAELPKEMQTEILEAYEYLDTKDVNNTRGGVLEVLKSSAEPIFVAVRSSATTEDLAGASFAGQQETFLNVKGKKELLIKIKECFASLFTARATYYRNKKGFGQTASLAVVVQKMVDSDKSGVIFSKDPTNKNDNIIIEAVFGLGEGIVSGQINPDNYIISKELEILEKRTADKKIAVTRNSAGKQETVRLKEEKSKQQVLKEYEIKKLAEIALKLEMHYKKPQDIEFAIENDEIYIVQTRPITTLEKRAERGKSIEGEVILTGLAASPGVASGKIRIINNVSELEKIKPGDILVTKMTNPDMVVSMQKSAAIVTDDGGLTAHAAIVSREMGIPAVVGTREATTKLKDGEIITVDGSAGKVYRGKVAETKQKEIQTVSAKTRTKMKVIVDMPAFAERAARTEIKHVGLTRIEGIIAESGKHPVYFLKKGKMEDYEEIIYRGIKGIAKFFDELWIRTSDIRSDEFQNLEGAPKEIEANPMLGMHGIRFGIKNKSILKAELNALKRVAEERKKKIGLLLPQIISVDEVREVRKILKEIGFSDAKVGIMVETPAAVQIIKELCEEKIDFISFGTNDLTQYILAVDRGNEEVQHLYNEMHPAVLYQLGFVIRVCKRANVETSICGQAGSNKEMVKFLVENGIDSISVNADMAKEISDYVAEIEKTLGEGPRQYQPKDENEDFLKPQAVIEDKAIEETEAPIINGIENIKEESVKDETENAEEEPVEDVEESNNETEDEDVEEETEENIQEPNESEKDDEEKDSGDIVLDIF